MPRRRTAALATAFAATAFATALIAAGVPAAAAGEARTLPAEEARTLPVEEARTPPVEEARTLPAPAAGPGDVCFYTETGYRGASWCYRPWGYTDVPEHIHDKARSFESNSDVVVYAIDHSGGRCYHRKIWTGDRSTDWSWGSRIDGVATEDMGCEIS